MRIRGRVQKEMMSSSILSMKIRMIKGFRRGRLLRVKVRVLRRVLVGL
jgi:hypothetical protein